MTDITIATRQEWPELRKRLPAEEKDLTRCLDALAGRNESAKGNPMAWVCHRDRY